MQFYSTLFNNYEIDAGVHVDFNTFKDKCVPLQFAMSTSNITLIEIFFIYTRLKRLTGFFLSEVLVNCFFNQKFIGLIQ